MAAKQRKLGWSRKSWKDMDPTGMSQVQRDSRAAALRMNMLDVNREMKELERYVRTYNEVSSDKRRILKMLARIENARVPPPPAVDN